MQRPPPVHVREIIKSIEHACQCYRTAEQQARYQAWQEQAGPPEPEKKPTQTIVPPREE